MTKIIAVLLSVISVLALFFLTKNYADTEINDTTATSTTAQPIFLPPGYNLERYVNEAETPEQFSIYADKFFIFQSSWFVRYKENGKDDVIYSLTCGDSGSKELINNFLEEHKSAKGEICQKLPKGALYLDSSFMGETDTVKTCVASDGYIYISYESAIKRFFAGEKDCNKFIEEIISKSLLWTPENPVTCG